MFQLTFLLRHSVTKSKLSHLRQMSTFTLSDALVGPFNFVDNVRCNPVDGSTEGSFDNLEPRSGKKLSEVKISGEREVDRAVKAAKLAGSEWSRVSWRIENCYLRSYENESFLIQILKT